MVKEVYTRTMLYLTRAFSIKMALATTALCCTFVSTAFAETSFSFSPAPVAKALLPGEKTNRISGTFVNLSADASSDTGETDFDIYGAIYTNRTRSGSNANRGGRYSINAFSGEGDVSSEISMVGLGFLRDWEFYGNKTGSLVYFVGFGLDYLDIELSTQGFDSSIGNFSGTLRLGVQNRFALGNDFGLTPFFLAIVNNTTLITEDDATDGDNFNSNSTTIGLDLDFRDVSLTAFYQDKDDIEIISLSLGVNF